MKVEQFVMAYNVEQDRIRAMLPKGFESLRPVFRINAEIRDNADCYIELNTPVYAHGKRGWLNIANWCTPATAILFRREGKSVTFETPFLKIAYIGVGIEGSCPAEKDNDGCFYGRSEDCLVPPEKISVHKEFCDCAFAWQFTQEDAHGESYGGKSLAAIAEPPQTKYPATKLLPENAAQIPCRQILGQYKVVFDR